MTQERETPDEMLERLQAMAVPDQQTWDLSERDQDAVRWALAMIADRKVCIAKIAELSGIQPARPLTADELARARTFASACACSLSGRRTVPSPDECHQAGLCVAEGWIGGSDAR